jgi:hypothetical protein
MNSSKSLANTMGELSYRNGGSIQALARIEVLGDDKGDHLHPLLRGADEPVEQVLPLVNILHRALADYGLYTHGYSFICTGQ